jgi:hemerythrin-like domain-containing protein
MTNLTRIMPKYADVRPMIVLHNALRREFRLLPALVRGVPDGGTERAQIVAEHIGFLTAILHAHHHGEDVVLWPILLDRGPAEITPIVHVMQGHHDQIDQIGEQIAAALTDWRASAGSTVGESLADALDRLIVVLDEHLGMEEERVLPVAAKHVTTTEWDQMGKAAGAEVDPPLRPVGVGMLMYEGDPEVVEVDMARMPPEVRELMKKTAPQAYEAHSLRVHGTLPRRSVD